MVFDRRSAILHPMMDTHSMARRLIVGKTVGLAIGLLGFFMLPVFLPDVSMMLRLGLLCWYATFGVVVSVFCAIDRHPVFGFPMPWWVSAPLLGSWLNFVLCLFAYDHLAEVMVAMFGEDGLILSPFWVVAEGLLIGLVVGFAADRASGSGRGSD